jgi:hypothetical protein
VYQYRYIGKKLGSDSDLDSYPDSNGLGDPDWKTRSESRQSKNVPQKVKHVMFEEFSVELEASLLESQCPL